MLSRLALLGGSLAWPLNALARAVAVTRSVGAQAGRMSGRSRPALLLDCWRFALLHNIAPKAYYKFRLFLPNHAARARYYLQDHESAVLFQEARTRIDPALAEQVDNKMEFDAFCRAASLPCAETIVTSSMGREAEWLADPAELNGDVILKLTNCASGKGIELAERDGELWTVQGISKTRDELIEYLRRKASEGGAILQKRLINHEAIRPLTGRGLSTVRIVTAVAADGSIELVTAAMRMATGSSIVDNIALGGLAAPIDLETGVLGLATGKDITLGWFRSHPDTGAQIEGFVVPFWSDACALSVRAHSLLSGVPTIGWDVVISPDGPRLLEGNIGWDVELAQSLGQNPLLRTPVGEALRRALALQMTQSKPR
jgi:hypothetical protein